MGKDENQFRPLKIMSTGSSVGLWFGSFLGAFAYRIHVHSGSLWLVILAFVKALIWPILLYPYAILKM